jgi:hypothetical protein
MLKSIKAPVWASLIGAIVMAVWAIIQTGMADHTPRAILWVLAVIAAVGAFNVWATANLPGYEHLKKYVAAGVAGLQVLTVVIVGGITGAEWVSILVAIGTALGVALVPHPVTTTTRPANLGTATGTTVTPAVVVTPQSGTN